MQALNSTIVAQQLWHFCREENIEFEIFSYSLQQAYLPLLTDLFKKYQQHREHQIQAPLLIGISGCQGSGKTTLAKLLKMLFEKCFDLSTISFSIDDFYLTKAERLKLAQNIHPLLATRGVPGTHDVQLALQTIQRLKTMSNIEIVKIPQFNKAIDDRSCDAEQLVITSAPQVIIFEGWCLGAIPQNEQQLQIPINQLEQDHDPEQIWRRYVNQRLEDSYQKLFAQIDHLIFLKAPSFDSVFEWRKEQEHQLAKKNALKKLENCSILNDQQLNEFILYFERITRHTIEHLPDQADYVISLNQHRFPRICKPIVVEP